MKLWATGLMLMSAPTLAAAQQVMDGSDKAFKEPIAAQIADFLSSATSDPYGAQLKGLRPSNNDPKDICGEVNLKNRLGAYTGFQPFIVYSGVLYLQDAEQCR